jgi:acetyl-CoA/propionyl-CoA carboxylase biotin carboxyl carrier protein
VQPGDQVRLDQVVAVVEPAAEPGADAAAPTDPAPAAEPAGTEAADPAAPVSLSDIRGDS